MIQQISPYATRTILCYPAFEWDGKVYIYPGHRPLLFKRSTTSLNTGFPSPRLVVLSKLKKEYLSLAGELTHSVGAAEYTDCISAKA